MVTLGDFGGGQNLPGIYSHPSQLNNSKRQRKLFGYCVEVLYNSLSLSQFLLGNFHSPNWCSLVRIAKSTRLIHQTSSTNQSPPKVFIFVILVVPWSWSLSSGAQGWDCHSFHDFQALLTTCNKTTTTRNKKSLLRDSVPSLFVNNAG